jgi:serine protease SohB
MEFWTEYGMFFLKAATVVGLPFLAILLLIAVIVGFAMEARAGGMAKRLRIEPYNRKLEQYELMLREQMESKRDFKETTKTHKERERLRDNAYWSEGTPRKRVFVLDFKGDVRASAVAGLKEEITALLTVATSGDEVVVRIDSGGGTVHGYGLAAAQLHRLKSRGIPLTVTVDKIAASGGYLMACVADRILAAPFAIIGSIGVIMQLPNFNRVLKEHNVDFEQITSGKFKRTLTVFGENTEKGRAKIREEIAETHELFKAFVKDFRGDLDIEEISTGEHWYGIDALERKLVDLIQTSDDYLFTLAATADVFELSIEQHPRLLERILGQAKDAGIRLYEQIFGPTPQV